MDVLSNAAARRIFLDRHGLSQRPTGRGKGADLSALIDSLGFVQLDSVNTFARAHDMVLWSRQQSYRPAALDPLLSRDRVLFEHWTHDASIMPIAHFPYWHHKFDRDRGRLPVSWAKWHGDGFDAKFAAIRDRIAQEGPLSSSDVGEDEGREKGWWNWHPSKIALEFLWRTGEVSVVRRNGFSKVFDLTERVIPAHLRDRQHTPDQIVDWACRKALAHLGFGTATELSAYMDIATKDEAKVWAAAALKRGEIREVGVTGVDGAVRKSYALPEAFTVPDIAPRLRILSPFDPALRDRARAERLFGFFYRIEMFVPAPKRIYGYYVFPVIEGDRLIGRIDMKTDRAADTLRVAAFWPEAGVSMGRGRLDRLDAELDRARVFAGLGGVTFAEGWLRAAHP